MKKEQPVVSPFSRDYPFCVGGCGYRILGYLYDDSREGEEHFAPYHLECLVRLQERVHAVAAFCSYEGKDKNERKRLWGAIKEKGTGPTIHMP